MRIGRHIGAALQRLPGVGTLVDRLRIALRAGRAARRRRRGGGPDRRYAAWVRAVDASSTAELQRVRDRAAAIRGGPVVSILLLPESAPPELLDRAIRAVRGQAYQAWELCVVTPGLPDAEGDTVRRHVAADSRVREVRFAGDDGADARNAALAAAVGDFVVVVGGADVLPPQALVHLAEAIVRRPGCGLVYADEDRIDGRGRRSDPWFKCDCNRELLLAQDAISRPAVYAGGLVRDLGGWRRGFAGAEDHDLALRAVARIGGDGVVHVPRILCHRGGGPPGVAAAESGRRAVRDMLHRRGSDATVEAAPGAPLCHRVRHRLPADPPAVSIVICTRDQERLLRVAVESIMTRTTYPHYELVVVDNGSVDPRAVAHLAALAARDGVRVLRDDGPFNYARLNNRAAATARGKLLCLLNDDVEVLTPDWLEEMVSFALQPDVGPVGARLWYPDGTLQHGGVILGIGRDAGHAHPRLRRGDPGYRGRAVLHQEWSAVTAACLVVRADVFAALSGLDERLAVAFNDVDFCLRARRAGYRVVWTPYAELIHHESASRGVDDTPRKRDRASREAALLRERWGEALRHDPFYNPNLSHVAADFSIDPPASRAA